MRKVRTLFSVSGSKASRRIGTGWGLTGAMAGEKSVQGDAGLIKVILDRDMVTPYFGETRIELGTLVSGIPLSGPGKER